MPELRFEAVIAIKNEATKKLKELRKNMRGLQKDVKKFSNRSKKSFADFKRSVGSASEGVKRFVKFGGAALVGVAIASVKMVADFEKSMTNVSTLLDTGVEDMEKMKKEVLEISKRTPKALGELTEALFDVRSAGIDAKDSMKVLEGSARLATAGLGTTKEATDIVTSALNAFNLTGKEAEDVYGQFFATTKAGKTTIAELSQGFGGVAGAVAAANIKLPDFLSAVSALTTTGLPASQAYTQLKAAIAGMTRETEEGAVVLNNLGATSFKDLVEKSGGMVNAFKLITEQVDGNDAAILKLFGSTEAYNAVVQLSTGLNSTYTDTLQTMSGASELLDEAFKKQTKTFDAQWTLLKNKLNVVMINMGNVVLPMVTEAMADLGVFIQENQELFTTLGEVLKVVVTIVGGLIKIFGVGLVEVFRFVAEKGNELGEALFDIFTAMEKAIIGTFNRIKEGIKAPFEFIQSKVDALANLVAKIPGFQRAVAGAGAELGARAIATQARIEGRADGGPVQRGKPFIVGERGPELFVPNQGGSIVPNEKLTTKDVNININFGGVNISKEVDADNFIQRIKEDLTRTLQLQRLGST